MITKVEVHFFKQFFYQKFDLKGEGLTLLVGGNNAGKSTLLEALALWEFAKSTIYRVKGMRGLCANAKVDGYGVTLDEFTPMHIPSFEYLWYNLKPGNGYSMCISCSWTENRIEKTLPIVFELNHAKLFMKAEDSNLTKDDKIPSIAYLPTFAGIQNVEMWCPPIIRRRYIGQGLAGAVLRNQIVELYRRHVDLDKELKNRHVKPKLTDEDKKILRADDYSEINRVLYEVFGGVLQPKVYNPERHIYVDVSFQKGTFHKDKFSKDYLSPSHDIMVEGRGFLQWLSVYVYAVSEDIDVLLLDEPDAHLHNTLQRELITRLQELLNSKNKQVLIASHSEELINTIAYENVYSMERNCYLKRDVDKSLVLEGIGTEYFPRAKRLARSKRVLFVENDSDAEILKIMAETCGIAWPKDLVIWPTAIKHKQRKHIFIELAKSIEGLKGISLVDRDEESYDQVDVQLQDREAGYAWQSSQKTEELRFRKWRRWEIESYLLSATAIARRYHKRNPDKAEETCYEEVCSYMREKWGLNVNEESLISNRTEQNKEWFDQDGKKMFKDICHQFHAGKTYDIACEMQDDEVFEDVKILLNQIAELLV